MAKFSYRQFHVNMPHISSEEYLYLKENQQKISPVIIRTFSDEFDTEIKLTIGGLGLGLVISLIINSSKNIPDNLFTSAIALIMVISVITGIFSLISLIASCPSYFNAKNQENQNREKIKMAVKKSNSYEEFLQIITR